MTAPMTLAAAAALVRLRQYGERTSTWSTATYNDGTEKALHEIALTLAAEVETLRTRVAELEAQAAVRLAAGVAAECRHLLYDADPDSTVPPLVDIHRHHTTRRGNR